MKRFWLLAAMLLAVPGTAYAGDCDVSTSVVSIGPGPDGIPGNADDPKGLKIDVTVDVDGSDKFRDIHFTCANGHKFGSFQGSTVSVDDGPGGASPQSWNVNRSPNVTTISITSGASNAGFGDGSYSFTIDFEDAALANAMYGLTWKVTKNGQVSHGESHVVDDSQGEPAPNGPTPKVRQNNAISPLLCPINATTFVNCETEAYLDGRNYEVYTSVSLNPNYTDALGIGIDNTTAPVPGSWNLTFQNLTGTISSTGEPAAQPRVSVPNDANLVGETFYTVFVVKTSGGSIEYFSDPLEITITN